jgi:hypothetical protein
METRTKDKNSEAILKLYKNCRELLLFQMEHFRFDLQNEFRAENPTEKKVLNEIDETMKSISVDIFLLSEFLTDVQNAESEEELFNALKCYNTPVFNKN